MAKKKVEKNNTINIKSQPVQAHIGAARFANDDWGTIAFSFPRTDLSLKFIDKELRYNSIYFLFGYEDGHEVAYVGQALKRKNGESALVRLREHDKSTTEPYRDKWSWVIVVTNKDDTWGATELNALESIFIQEVPEKNNLNGRGQNNGGADISLYEDKVTQIKALITAIGFKIFEDIPEKENIQVISEVNEYSIVEDLQNGMARIPEIVTPDKVVKAMVDMLPAEVWNRKTKFLDPACKGGEYLREIYDRLMENETMQSDFENPIERSTHILKNQIYGIALSQVSLDRTTKKLFGEDRNIKIIPDYINKLKGIDMGSRPDGKQNNIGDILNKEFGKDMEFDVVIGNPPYQENDGSGGKGGAGALYDKFILNSINISKIVSLITPSRYFVGGRGLGKFRDIWLTNTHIKSIKHFTNSSEIFSGVKIAGGVSYFLWNIDYDNSTEGVKFTINNCDSRFRKLNEKDVFIIDALSNSITTKVVQNMKMSIKDIIKDKYYYGIDRICMVQSGDTNLFDNSGITYGCLNSVDLKNTNTGYKVVTSSMTPDATIKPYSVLNPVYLLDENTVPTSGYMVLDNIKTKEYAEIVRKYLLTKLVRLMIFNRRIGVNANSDAYAYVPLQDFTSSSDIDWSQSISNIDQQLYKKYNLSDEEIAYIESTIKPME